MESNSRERAIHAARKKISDTRLIAFLRAARKTSSGVLAVSLACDAFDEGKSLDDLFYDGDIYGYSLRVIPKEGGKYHIEFGCQAGPMAGDGGAWTVAFEGDVIASIRGGRSYIS